MQFEGELALHAKRAGVLTSENPFNFEDSYFDNEIQTPRSRKLNPKRQSAGSLRPMQSELLVSPGQQSKQTGSIQTRHPARAASIKTKKQHPSQHIRSRAKKARLPDFWGPHFSCFWLWSYVIVFNVSFLVFPWTYLEHWRKFNTLPKCGQIMCQIMW